MCIFSQHHTFSHQEIQGKMRNIGSPTEKKQLMGINSIYSSCILIIRNNWNNNTKLFCQMMKASKGISVRAYCCRFFQNTAQTPKQTRSGYFALKVFLPSITSSPPTSSPKPPHAFLPPTPLFPPNHLNAIHSHPARLIAHPKLYPFSPPP